MYRVICTQFWTDPAIKQLSVPGKLLFVYLITNPHTHLSGIYYLPLETIAKETGLSVKYLDALFETLSKLNKAYRDALTETVLVVNMFSYQGKGEKNERAAANHLRSLHGSSLITLFLARYPAVIPFISDTLSDTLYDRDTGASKRCPSVPSYSSSSSSPNPNGEKIVKKRGLREISEEDQPTEKHLVLAHSLGIDPAPEWAKFKNYCKAHGKRYADFEAAFRNWLVSPLQQKRS